MFHVEAYISDVVDRRDDGCWGEAAEGDWRRIGATVVNVENPYSKSFIRSEYLISASAALKTQPMRVLLFFFAAAQSV